MARSTAVLIALIACGGALLAMGIWGGRRTHNVSDFFLASRRLNAGLVALSYVANASPTWMLLAISGAAFAWGVSAVWIWAAVVLGYLLNSFWVAPRLRQLSVGQDSLTLLQVLSVDAGDRMQPLIIRSAALILSLALLLEMGAVLNSVSQVFATSFGFDVTTSAITAVTAVVVFTLAGGYWALSLADAVQLAVVALIALVIPVVALVGFGGMEQMQAGFDALGTATTDWFGGRSGVVAVAFVAGISGFGFDLVGQPHAASRFMAARDETTLALSRWIALAAVAVLLALMLVCGWCASVLYAGLERPEQALFAMAERMLPPMASAFIVALLLGCVLVGLGNRLVVLASCLSIDMKRSSSPLAFAWSRVVLVGYAIVALCFSLYANGSLLNQAMFSFHVLGASLGPLLLVRLTGKRVRPGSTLGAMWAGFVLTLLFHALPDAPGDFLERVLPFVAALGIALTGGERRRNPDRADRAQQTVHDRVPI